MKYLVALVTGRRTKWAVIAVWIVMVGFILALHFGALLIITPLWRRAGFDVAPLMDRPARSRSLAEFWGRRWNTGFSSAVRELVFVPLGRRFGASAALALVFLISGLIHDLVISIPARGGFGLPTLYFLVQLVGILIERTRIARRLGLSRYSVAARAYTFALTILPLPLLFHAAFLRSVMTPFAHAIGALREEDLMNTLRIMILIAGALHLAITSAGVTMTRVLDWRRNLAPLAGLTRHVIWTHATFVLMTIIAFGVVSLACAGPLASGEPLARAVCAFIAIFWGTRLFVQFFLFDTRSFLTNLALKLGYHGLTMVFAYFTFTYGLAALAAPLGRH